MTPILVLTLASIKMFFRNRQALFFSLFLPFMIMVIFGALNFDAFARVDLGVVDEAQDGSSETIVTALEAVDALEVIRGTRSTLVKALEDGKLDYLVILSRGLDPSGAPAKVQALFNANRPQEAQVGTAILSRVLDELSFKAAGVPRLYELEAEEVKSRSYDYDDFLVPGIIAMSIMQMGLFSVTFSVIQYRQQGVLRRLKAAPIHPSQFLAAQVITRLTIAVLQTLVLLVVGIFMLGVDVRGNFGTLILLALIGGGLFISMGYAVSGFARSEESAAPIANLIALPMMFLGGVFFARDNLPAVLEKITDYFPLTYLADALRDVTVEGASLANVSGELLGLVVWLAVSFFIATRVFRWE